MFDIPLIPGLFISVESVKKQKPTPTKYVEEKLRPRSPVSGKIVTKAVQDEEKKVQRKEEYCKQLRPRNSKGKVLKPLSKAEIQSEICEVTGISIETQKGIFSAMKLFLETHNEESIDLTALTTTSNKSTKKPKQ